MDFGWCISESVFFIRSCLIFGCLMRYCSYKDTTWEPRNANFWPSWKHFFEKVWDFGLARWHRSRHSHAQLLRSNRAISRPNADSPVSHLKILGNIYKDTVKEIFIVQYLYSWKYWCREIYTLYYLNVSTEIFF